MKMSLQYQYTLDMEKERGQTALLQFYDFKRAKAPTIITVYGHHKVRIILW